MGLTVEVIIPSLRQKPTERLVASLLLQTRKPDTITIVSNELQAFSVRPWWRIWELSRVRLLRFESDAYCIGELDVTLRQNAGIWAAREDIVIIQGDDQIAPPTMVEDSLRVLGDGDYLWGNHRLLDYGEKTLDEIRLMDPHEALSRENPYPPALHGYASCYGGMLVTRTEFIREFGGFDMACNCRHANEDQQLGYRLMRRSDNLDKVRIEEPPFSFHGLELKGGDDRERQAWMEPVRNGCGPGNHDLYDEMVKKFHFVACSRCAFRQYQDHPEFIFQENAILRYRPSAVRTTSVWL